MVLSVLQSTSNLRESPRCKLSLTFGPTRDSRLEAMTNLCFGTSYACAYVNMMVAKSYYVNSNRINNILTTCPRIIFISSVPRGMELEGGLTYNPPCGPIAQVLKSFQVY